MKPINMTVFLFACESAFCGTSRAKQIQSKHSCGENCWAFSPVQGVISPTQTNGFSEAVRRE
jgi:hypothetical protein